MFHRTVLVGILMAMAASVRVGTGGVLDNPGVPASEKASLGLVYEFSIPVTSGGWNSVAVPYTVDNAASIPVGSFDRVAYYLELEKPDTTLDWVYVSFDAAGFTNNASKTGVPNTASGEYYNFTNTTISNMNVYSNVAGVATGTGITTGNVEFWPSNYGASNDYGVPGANGGTYDFGDGGSNTGAGHGTMQVHNYGAGQTLFAYNAWGAVRTSELGIGNQPSGNPDWTFNTSNISTYTVRTLQVLVGTPPELTWDGTVNNWGTAHWLGAPPTYPDASAKATIGGGLVTVEADHAAYALTMTGGQVAIGAGNTLDVIGDLDASGGAITLGAGSTLKAGSGAIGSLSTGGDSTIEVSGSLSVAGSTYNDQGIAGTMTKQGAGTLSLDNISGSGVIAGDTTFRVEAGTLKTVGADPLGGSQNVVMAGGTLTVEGAPFMVDGLAGSLFRSIPRNETYVNLDGANYQHTSGRVFTGDKASTILTTAAEAGYNIVVTGSTRCDNNNDWGPFPTLSSDWEDMVTAYSGRFTPRVDGVHNFHWNNDDRGLMYIDLNDDNVFDNSERVAAYAWNANGNVTLNAGQGYNVVYMAQEFGGGRNVWWAMTEPGGGEAIINPSDGRGTWQTGGAAAIDLQTTLTVDTAAVSTLRLISGYGANLRELALKDGSLQITGATGLTVEQASISTATSGTVGLMTDTPTVLTDVAGFNGNGQTVRIAKGGAADLILNKLGTGLENATFAAEGGRLVGVHGSNPFGAATLEVNGGEIVLSSAGGNVTYDNPVHVTGDGTLTAGQAGGGVAGPLTVTLGSMANGVSIDAGRTLTMRSTDNYTLDVAGQLSSGNVKVTEGIVALSGGGAAAKLEVKAAATASTLGLTVSDEFKVGNLTLTASGTPFGLSGENLGTPSATQHRTVSLSGGEVAVRNGSTVPDGVQLWLDAGTISGLNNGDPVTTWADQSGYGRDAGHPQGNPTYVAIGPNGQPVVNFLGSSNSRLYTDYNFDALTEHSILTVARYTGGDSERVVSSMDHNWLFGFHGNGDGRYYAEGWIANSGSSNTTWRLHAGTINDDPDPLASFWRDGNLIVANNNGSNNTNYRPGRLSLGGWSGSEFSNCEIAEVLIFNRVLTPDELNNVGGYLKTKYGITAPNYTGGLGTEAINLPYTDIHVTADSTLMLDTTEAAVLGNVTLDTGSPVMLTLAGPAPKLTIHDLVASDGSALDVSSLTEGVAVQGMLRPAGSSTGALAILGDMTLDGAEFLVDVACTLPGSEDYDQLVFEGSLLQLINASLTVTTPLDASAMHVGTEIPIVDIITGTREGTFAGLGEGAEFADQNSVYRWEIYYGGPTDDIKLKLTYVPEPATLALLGLGSLLLARRRRKRC